MDSSTTDRASQLFVQARGGDPLALGPLLGCYTRQLHRLATFQLDEKLRNRLSPSDIVQETLLQASEGFAHFRGSNDAEFGSWLRRILARKLSRSIERHLLAEKRDVRREVGLDHVEPRRNAVQRRDGEPAAFAAGQAFPAPRRAENHFTNAVHPAIADHRPGPASEAVHSERDRAVARAIAALPVNYRVIVQMRNVQGLPFDEIARQLNRTSGAARMLWLRAIEMLRQQLQSQELN